VHFEVPRIVSQARSEAVLNILKQRMPIFFLDRHTLSGEGRYLRFNLVLQLVRSSFDWRKYSMVQGPLVQSAMRRDPL